MNTRDYYFDNLKFLLITLVVIGHLIEPLNEDPILRPIYLMIYTFHIPLFVLISGYFAKNIGSGDYLNKVISRLIVPYLLFESLYSLFDFWIYDRAELKFSYFTPYWLMWFFLSMILWKVAMPYIIRIRYALPIVIGIAILAGYANDAQYYASVSRTLVFFPFFLIGYYMDKSWIEKLRTTTMRIISGVGLILTYVIMSSYGYMYKKEWFFGSFSYESLGHPEWSAGLYRVAVYVAAVLIGGMVMILIPQRSLPWISTMGTNTLYTYLLHGFIVLYLTAGDAYSHFTTTTEKLLLIPLGIMLTMVLSFSSIRYLFKWLVEPKMKLLLKHSQSRSNRKSQTE